MQRLGAPAWRALVYFITTTTTFQPLAVYFADDLSETVAWFFAPNPDGAIAALVLDDTGVATSEGAAFVQHLSRLLATGYRAKRSNDHQSHLDPGAKLRTPARLVLENGSHAVRLRLWTATITNVPHLAWELSREPNMGGASGQFVLTP